MSDMEEEMEGGEEEESEGPSLTKKLATGVALGVATTAVAAGARKLMGDSGEEEEDGEDDGDESDESSEGSSSQLASGGPSASRSSSKRSGAKRSSAKRSSA